MLSISRDAGFNRWLTASTHLCVARRTRRTTRSDRRRGRGAVEVVALREIIKQLQRMLELETEDGMREVIGKLLGEAAERLVARQRSAAA